MQTERKLASSSMMMIFFLLLFSTTFQGCFSASNRPQNNKEQSTARNRFGSSVIFPVTGNVNKGYYHVTLNIGRPPKPYFLDIDTGSDLTWLQCDAPCTKCTPTPHSLYKPHKNIVTCKDPVCTSLHGTSNHPCESADEQCDYVVEYADDGSSMGVLVKDYVPLRFTNGSIFGPNLVLGCGYNQEVPDHVHAPYTDGVLGLGNGKLSFVSQLHNMGLIRNVMGHCLSGKGGGFLFLGDDLIPSSGVVWTPMLQSFSEKQYSLGSAELLYGMQATGVKGVPILFDSGSTYTYFSSQVYKATLSMIKKQLNRKQLQDAVEDDNLPVCWKGAKPFKSIHDVKDYFKPLVVRFSNKKNIQLQLPPEAYLVVTEHGSVCLGILNGSEIGLGNSNIIGDISMQDKMVIYDNEKQQIGWVPANCDRLLNVDRGYNEGFYQPYAANLAFLEERHSRGYRWKEDL